MKTKSIILKIIICLLLSFMFCQCDHGMPPPPTETPCWTIIKFKKHEYENYIMPPVIDRVGFCMCHDFTVCKSDVFGKNPYIGLPKDYVFVDYKWDPTWFLNDQRRFILLPWSEFTEYSQDWPPETPSRNDLIEKAYWIYSKSLSDFEENIFGIYTCSQTDSFYREYCDSIQNYHIELISSMLESDDFEEEMNNRGVIFKRISL